MRNADLASRRLYQGNTCTGTQDGLKEARKTPCSFSFPPHFSRAFINVFLAFQLFIILFSLLRHSEISSVSTRSEDPQHRPYTFQAASAHSRNYVPYGTTEINKAKTKGSKVSLVTRKRKRRNVIAQSHRTE